MAASSAALAGTAMADEAAAGTVVGTAAVNFTQEADILIISTGIGGLAAGMEPALAGKKIIFCEKKGSFGGDSASSCWFMFASGSKPQLDAGLTTTIAQAWEAVTEKQTAGFDQCDWYPEWAKSKHYANTKFVDCAIENFGCEFQQPASDEELPRLTASVILPVGASTRATPISWRPCRPSSRSWAASSSMRCAPVRSSRTKPAR